MTPTDIPDSLDEILARCVAMNQHDGYHPDWQDCLRDNLDDAKSAIEAWAYREFIALANKATIRREAGFNLHTSQMEYIDVVDKAELRAKAAAHFNQKETT